MYQKRHYWYNRENHSALLPAERRFSSCTQDHDVSETKRNRDAWLRPELEQRSREEREREDASDRVEARAKEREGEGEREKRRNEASMFPLKTLGLLPPATTAASIGGCLHRENKRGRRCSVTEWRAVILFTVPRIDPAGFLRSSTSATENHEEDETSVDWRATFHDGFLWSLRRSIDSPDASPLWLNFADSATGDFTNSLIPTVPFVIRFLPPVRLLFTDLRLIRNEEIISSESSYQRRQIKNKIK